MPRAMTIAGLVVSSLLALVFALDLFIEFPFHRVSMVMDIGFLISSLVLGFLSWTTLREQS
ncbi:MAG: hypothetical protein JW829_15825 [Pirellulales bacterium]|nr:hypothetical protein [Pirellulales bacterium]